MAKLEDVAPSYGASVGFSERQKAKKSAKKDRKSKAQAEFRIFGTEINHGFDGFLF